MTKRHWRLYEFCKFYLLVSYFKVFLKEPCIFAVENGHFIDNESWNFFEDLVSDSHAVLVMTIKPLNTVTNFPESAKRLIADTQTVKMTLGMNRL